MKSGPDCILCNNVGMPVVINNLQLFHCKNCGLFWRNEFVLPVNHYKEQDFKLGNEKILSRISNAQSRIKKVSSYVDLNNVCDIGCGEGVFLKTLKDAGFKNLVGVEPGDMAQTFAHENGLLIEMGDIKTSGRVIKSHHSSTVTMFHVIEHLEDPIGDLKVVSASLNVGDSLVLETPDMESYIMKKVGHVHELVYPEHFFYFNIKNIDLLLKKAGFQVFKKGHRDFDENHMSIKESLVRLGFIKTSQYQLNSEDRGSAAQRVVVPKDYLFKKVVRFILSRLVQFLGRGNYMWVIARKI